MKSLVVEDDFGSRLYLQAVLAHYGECHIAVNGLEAVQAVEEARRKGHAYDLICMDILMPEMDGQTALRHIREQEEAENVPSQCAAKIVMTTAADDFYSVSRAFRGLCDAYLTKPFDPSRLAAELAKLGLVKTPARSSKHKTAPPH